MGHRRGQHIVGTAWRLTLPSSILGPKGESEWTRLGHWHTDGSSIALLGGAVPGLEDGRRLVSDETDLRRPHTKDATRRDGRGVRRSYISWSLRCCRATPQWQQATAAHHNDPEHHRRHPHRAYSMRHTSVSSLCLPATPAPRSPLIFTHIFRSLLVRVRVVKTAGYLPPLPGEKEQSAHKRS